MTRKKVKLAYIANDSSRKATYKKRKKGLLKKVNELSTLCGIDACLLIYSSFETQSGPVVWPSPLGAQRVLEELRKMPEMEQCKKMVNQESYMRQRISKANEQLEKCQKDNREKQMTQVMFNCFTIENGLQNLGMVDLHDLGWLIDKNLKDINRRMDILRMRDANVVATGLQRGGHNTGQVYNETGMQKYQTYTDVVNPPQHMSFCGEETMLPLGIDNNNQSNLWYNEFLP